MHKNRRASSVDPACVVFGFEESSGSLRRFLLSQIRRQPAVHPLRERLDAKYFLSPGVRAAERMAATKAAGTKFVLLGGPGGLGKVWAPLRFKRAYAANGEKSVPYLRPYDSFEYLPVAADHLSTSRTKRIDSYQLKEGMILQTCSGRNLGPALLVDKYMSRFVLSHDMIRIQIEDEEMRLYVLAFLQSETGQQLLKRDKTGSVIDHISDHHVAAQSIPMLPVRVRKEITDEMAKAVKLREKSRLALSEALIAYEQSLPKPERKTPTKDGWAVMVRAIDSRIDAARYDPLVSAICKNLLKIDGCRVDLVAKVIKPPGRYKTHYVDKGNGRPLLSGAQVLQSHPVNLRYMAGRAFKDVTKYEIHEGWITYQADGRAEESLGFPAVTTSDRDGWLASGHVGRVVANEGVRWGWLWLACSTWHVQKQIKAMASGSVVDSTFPADMAQVILPPPSGVDAQKIENAWRGFVAAKQSEDNALQSIQDALNP